MDKRTKVSLFRALPDNTEESKEEYFKKYLELKEKCRLWHKANKKQKVIKLWSSRLIYFNEEYGLWGDLLKKQSMSYNIVYCENWKRSRGIN